jgi:hypothetical protein
VKLVSGQVSTTAKLALHPLFAQVKEIQLLEDELNKKCIELIQNGSVTISPEQSK